MPQWSKRRRMIDHKTKQKSLGILWTKRIGQHGRTATTTSKKGKRRINVGVVALGLLVVQAVQRRVVLFIHVSAMLASYLIYLYLI